MLIHRSDGKEMFAKDIADFSFQESMGITPKLPRFTKKEEFPGFNKQK